MVEILIYKSPSVYENLNSVVKYSIVTQAEHRKTLGGEDTITMTVESAMVRNFGIGDYIKLPGMTKYRINQMPVVTKNSARKYIYELTFEGPQYDLSRVSFRNTDVLGVQTAADFYLIGDIEMFLNVIINNLNRVFGEGKWALGTFPASTSTKNLLFNTDNCLTVLQNVCTEYNYQFRFTETPTQTVLHVETAGTDLDMSFKYGYGNGLYRLTRDKVDTKNMVNTLWAYGSTKNIPANYKDHTPRLCASYPDAPIIETTSVGNFGTFEGSIIFEDIYPHRTGTVSAVYPGNRLQFSDSGMDFDLNASAGGETLYLIPGNSAKVVFQTGNLAGYEFEVSSYLTATKTFTLNQNKDPKGIDMPSDIDAAFQIKVGDTYVIVDIIMPPSYITTAEEELISKATEYLEANSYPQVKYSLDIDEMYLERVSPGNTNIFNTGDTIVVLDEDLGINSRIKIAEFTHDILRPYRYSLVISDSKVSNVLTTFLVQNRYVRNFMEIKKLNDPVRAVTDWRSDVQLIAEIPKHLNDTKDLTIGQGELSETVSIGKNGSVIKTYGNVQMFNSSSFKAEFGLDSLTQDRVVALPDEDIIVNDWDYLVGTPDSFPPDSTYFKREYGLIGTLDGINKVFETSLAFVAGSTGLYLNGIRQFRGTGKHYNETGANEITFTEAPDSLDDIIIDYIKV